MSHPVCYREIKDKVTLECKHELCVRCFIEMNSKDKEILISTYTFKCHMCRKQYNWKKETVKSSGFNSGIASEDSLELIIKEDEENLFLPLVGMNSKAFEVILRINNNSFVFINHSLKIIQFIVVLKNQIETETLKFLISEFVVNRVTDDLGDIIGNLRGNHVQYPSFSHLRNITDSSLMHLESFYDNLVIKKYE